MIALNITHGDDNAVAVLATAMVSKLAQARAKGRSGWDTPECTQQHLSDLLRAHVAKGDPVDVANFCAFLTARGEGIAGAAPAAVAGPAREEIAVLRAEHGITSNGRGIKEFEQVDAFVRAVLQRWGAAPALEAPAAPATPVQVQALRLARRALYAIGKTYDDSELRVRALEADEEIGRLLAAAPQAPAAPVDEQSPRDSICAWSVWWTHNKAKFTTPRQSALAAWNHANERALRAMAAPAAPAVDAETARKAARYDFLRSRDLSAIEFGGVFAGRTPDNVVLNGDDLDAAIDAAMATTAQQAK